MSVDDKPIYLDYNATTPIIKEVADAMLPFLYENFGNPSSNHYYGQLTKAAIEKARVQIATLFNCDAEEIVFTSGGTESNNYALKGIAFACQNKGKHIISTKIEHPAILEVLNYLENKGFEVSLLDVGENGVVSIQEFEKTIRPDTILATVMHANNETGAIQPISELGEICRSNDVLFHSDAAQSVGKIKVDIEELNVDLLSFAGHKFYGPKGVGGLFVKKGVVLEKYIHGANHERNLRAGTENIIEIVGLGKAAELVSRDIAITMEHSRRLRDLLLSEIMESDLDYRVNSDINKTLPNTLSVSFKGVSSNEVLKQLTGVCASAGAACHSEGVSMSHVLEAIGIPIDYALGTFRFSTGRGLSEEDIYTASKLIIDEIVRLR
ncbi:MAG: cysteine desulfurase family protein [Bacteroidales bacterium]